MADRIARSRRGRPKAIPEGLTGEVISLYREGLGYRVITRELEKSGVIVSFSSVRRVIKQHIAADECRLGNVVQSNSETILKLDVSAKITKTTGQGPKDEPNHGVIP